MYPDEIRVRGASAGQAKVIQQMVQPQLGCLADRADCVDALPSAAGVWADGAGAALMMDEAVLAVGGPWLAPCIFAESSIVSPLGLGSAIGAAGASWESEEVSLTDPRPGSCMPGLTAPPLRRSLTAMPAACAVASSRSSSRKELGARDSEMDCLHQIKEIQDTGLSHEQSHIAEGLFNPEFMMKG